MRIVPTGCAEVHLQVLTSGSHNLPQNKPPASSEDQTFSFGRFPISAFQLLPTFNFHPLAHLSLSGTQLSALPVAKAPLISWLCSQSLPPAFHTGTSSRAPSSSKASWGPRCARRCFCTQQKTALSSWSHNPNKEGRKRCYSHFTDGKPGPKLLNV